MGDSRKVMQNDDVAAEKLRFIAILLFFNFQVSRSEAMTHEGSWPQPSYLGNYRNGTEVAVISSCTFLIKLLTLLVYY